jgi:hypothetical protein
MTDPSPVAFSKLKLLTEAAEFSTNDLVRIAEQTANQWASALYIERTEDKKIKETTFGTTSDGRRVAKKRERWSPLTASLLVGTLELDRKKKGH